MKSLRVLFVSRPNLHQQKGGDSLHLEQNRLHLKKFAVHSELWNGKQNPRDFDLIHFYGISRPAELIPLLKTKVPVVVSSIYVDYSEADRKSSKFRAFLQKGLGQHALDYLKLVARVRSGRDKWPSWDYLLEGQKGSIQKILDRCQHLITASQAEFKIIQSEFNYTGAQSVVKLGTEHLPPINPGKGKKDVLCVARIEPIKNQVKLIEAHAGQNWKLHLAGDAAPAHLSYLEKCKKSAGPKVLFHKQRNQEECASMYNNAKVHVLPSLYESTGLASLEALNYGCQIVVNDSEISRELFEDHAFYTDVNDPKKIQAAVNEALKSNEDHIPWLQKNFRWNEAASGIRDIYDQVLKSRS